MRRPAARRTGKAALGAATRPESRRRRGRATRFRRGPAPSSQRPDVEEVLARSARGAGRAFWEIVVAALDVRWFNGGAGAQLAPPGRDPILGHSGSVGDACRLRGGASQRAAPRAARDRGRARAQRREVELAACRKCVGLQTSVGRGRVCSNGERATATGSRRYPRSAKRNPEAARSSSSGVGGFDLFGLSSDSVVLVLGTERPARINGCGAKRPSIGVPRTSPISINSGIPCSSSTIALCETTSGVGNSSPRARAASNSPSA